MEGATHFIEQYNNKTAYYKKGKQNEFFTPPLRLSYLKDSISHTASMTTVKTVAVFKIKWKNK